jgi:tetratricopeptide (TPR) repeat protein/tRNA A-37 threonylcarbamoyl transferase component Bud32
MSLHLDGLKAALADRYAIESELGQGGMATVYLARDLKHKREVAIKVLKPELAAALGAERFLGEIEITAHLTHPHILPLHDSGNSDGWLYYVMPYVEGESLQDRIDRMGRLDVREAVRIAREVADALAYAHEQGVIHRDIKPANLLLVSGHAVVADFGIARAVTEAGGEGLTGTGAIMGTPTYMSPEQASGDELDGRADVYALGCVLYEMLTGEPPYSGPGLTVLASHLEDEVPSAQASRAEVPDEVDAVIRRAMAKSPQDRHGTAQEFGEALRAAVRGEALRRHGTLPATLITYGAGGWLLYQGIGWATREYFMPDWVRATALGLLLIGLLVFLTTALLQRRVRLRPSRADRLFSWRNAFAGGVAAFITLGLGAGGFLASRALGIGPAASLVAQGVLDERDQLILADFGGTDSILARTATEALRIDLAGSEAVTLITPRALRGVLQRMQLDPNEPLVPAVATEAAVREGVKGVIAGRVNEAGSGFLLTMQLVTPEDGRPLVSDRETAADSDHFIEAINHLSRRLRSRLGESVRSIRSTPALARYTTGSLEALKRYTAGLRAENQGDNRTALARYEEAVALDTAFAFAYRKIGNVLGNRREDTARMITAMTKAHQLRDGLPELERLQIESRYHTAVTGQLELGAVAEERIAEIRGGVFGGNLGLIFQSLRDYDRAEEALEAGIENGSMGSAFVNLWELQAGLGRFDDAATTLDRWAERAPENPGLHFARARLAAARGQYDVASVFYGELANDPNPGHRVDASEELGNLDAIHGRLDEAESRFSEVLTSHQERGRGGDYLEEVTWLGEIDLWGGAIRSGRWSGSRRRYAPTRWTRLLRMIGRTSPSPSCTPQPGTRPRRGLSSPPSRSRSVPCTCSGRPTAGGRRHTWPSLAGTRRARWPSSIGWRGSRGKLATRHARFPFVARPTRGWAGPTRPSRSTSDTWRPRFGASPSGMPCTWRGSPSGSDSSTTRVATSRTRRGTTGGSSSYGPMRTRCCNPASVRPNDGWKRS